MNVFLSKKVYNNYANSLLAIKWIYVYITSMFMKFKENKYAVLYIECNITKKKLTLEIKKTKLMRIINIILMFYVLKHKLILAGDGEQCTAVSPE